MNKFLRQYFFSKSMTKKECTDTGMAMVLIILLLGYFTGNGIYYSIGIPVLVVVMVYPKLFYPLAVLWFGLTHILGSIVSKILLSVIYIVILMPIGMLRRLMGKDPMQIKVFKQNSQSVMLTRDHEFTSDDVIHPY